MGIDKADIRASTTTTCPRAGELLAGDCPRRDGRLRLRVVCCPDDLNALENFVYGDTPGIDSVKGLVREVFGQGDGDVSVYDLSGSHDVRPLVVNTLLTYLSWTDSSKRHAVL